MCDQAIIFGGNCSAEGDETEGEKTLSILNISNILLALERLKELQNHETCRQKLD